MSNGGESGLITTFYTRSNDTAATVRIDDVITHHSTETALLKVLSDVTSMLQSTASNATAVDHWVGLLLDLSAAFDCVERRALPFSDTGLLYVSRRQQLPAGVFDALTPAD